MAHILLLKNMSFQLLTCWAKKLIWAQFEISSNTPEARLGEIITFFFLNSGQNIFQIHVKYML